MNADTVDGSKILAKALMKQLKARDQDIKHSSCLEAVAKGSGYANWQDLHHLIAVEGVDEWSDELCQEELLAKHPTLDHQAITEALSFMREKFGHWQ